MTTTESTMDKGTRFTMEHDPGVFTATGRSFRNHHGTTSIEATTERGDLVGCPVEDIKATLRTVGHLTLVKG